MSAGTFNAGSVVGTIDLRYDKATNALKVFEQQTKSAMSRASGWMKQHESEISRTSAKVAAVGAAITAVMYKFVQAAMEEERSETKLRAAITATGRAIDAGKLIKYAEQLGEVVPFAHEATQSMMALLVTMGFTEEQILRLTPIIQNLSSLFGRDLTQTARLVGRTILTGVGGGLTRLGIIIDKSILKTKDFDLILVELDKRSKGVAERMSKDMTGSVKMMQIQIDELSEEIGKNLLPAFRNIVTQVRDVVKRFREWAKENPELAKNITLITTKVGLMAVGFAAAAQAISVLITLFSGPAGWIAVLALATGATALFHEELLKIVRDKAFQEWMEKNIPLFKKWSDWVGKVRNEGVYGKPGFVAPAGGPIPPALLNTQAARLATPGVLVPFLDRKDLPAKVNAAKIAFEMAATALDKLYRVAGSPENALKIKRVSTEVQRLEKAYLAAAKAAGLIGKQKVVAPVDYKVMLKNAQERAALLELEIKISKGAAVKTAEQARYEWAQKLLPVWIAIAKKTKDTTYVSFAAELQSIVDNQGKLQAVTKQTNIEVSQGYEALLKSNIELAKGDDARTAAAQAYVDWLLKALMVWSAVDEKLGSVDPKIREYSDSLKKLMGDLVAGTEAEGGSLADALLRLMAPSEDAELNRQFQEMLDKFTEDQKARAQEAADYSYDVWLENEQKKKDFLREMNQIEMEYWSDLEAMEDEQQEERIQAIVEARARLDAFNNQWHQKIIDFAVSLKSTFADFFTGLLNGTVRFGDLWKGILGQINQMLGNIIAEFVWMQTIGSLLKKFLGSEDAAQAMKQAGIMQLEAADKMLLASVAMRDAASTMAATGGTGGGGGGGILGIVGQLFGVSGGGGGSSGTYAGIWAPQPYPMAAGGIVTKPTLALVGEAGPEMIVPLNSRRSERGSSGTTNVYLSVQALDARGVSDLLLRDGGKAVAAAVGAAVAGNSPIGRRR